MSAIPPQAITAEMRATAIIAIAHALVGAANDFGHGNQIAGDAMVLAEAAFAAAAPFLAEDEREQCAQLAEQGAASADLQVASDEARIVGAVLRNFATQLRETTAAGLPKRRPLHSGHHPQDAP